LLSDVDLLIEANRLVGSNQRLPTLLLLYHLEQPAKTSTIMAKAVGIGFRRIQGWNVSDILRVAAARSEVAQLNDGWRLLDPGVDALKGAGVQLGRKKAVVPTNSVVPRELFEGTRKYIEKVVDQINSSYDHELYDCCAVMCRRLGETLIIEVYEQHDRADEIKGSDGNFQMLNGLLSVLAKDKKINLGRNAKRGLEELKELGDKSAHNRRFNARKSDIDAIKAGLRTASEELLHIAKLAR